MTYEARAAELSRALARVEIEIRKVLSSRYYARTAPSLQALYERRHQIEEDIQGLDYEQEARAAAWDDACGW